MMNPLDVRIEESWKVELQHEFSKPYFHQLVHFLKEEKKNNKTIYPAGKDIFNAFAFTPFEQVKVLILGQDPYHGPGQANGLCFSVNDGIPFPPSLQNIFKELQDDVQIPYPLTGNLTPWAKQGILLLNASLTVEQGKPLSHEQIGWHLFTDEVIRILSEKKNNIVFVLWGAFARKKKFLIDDSKHLVLEAAHPSPLSAHKGFFGCRHFSAINVYLNLKGKKMIDWKI
jgi:Uracil-DNA glycosylase (EC 3.2.2.-)